MEIAPGQAMTITGPVFCNQSIWEGASDTTFASTVEAVGTNNTTANDPFALNYSKDGNPTFTLPGQPVSGSVALNLRFGTNNEPNTVQSVLQLQLPPASYALGSTAAYSTNGQVYLCNAADLYISNSISGTNSITPHGTNTFIFYQDASAASPLTLVNPDYYKLKTGGITNYVRTNLTAGIDSMTNVLYASYSFITNAIFNDWREGWNGGSGIAGKGKVVQAVQIDIAKFNAWLTNSAASNNGTFFNATCLLHKGHPIDSMYVYTGVPLTANTLPAVRILNGIQLPSPNGSRSGFTLATQFPLYVLGNYNAKDTTGTALGLYGSSTATVHTYPAALMADSITILSTNWSDATTSKLPNSGNTTVNAAMFTGIVPSDPTISGDYSGGVENFMRFLEDWSKGSAGGTSQQTLTYNGSIVVMFRSQYATNHWLNAGNYYNAPLRNWSFDQNFNTFSKLPPLTPQLVSSTNLPVISIQPQNQTVASGNNVTFNVVTGGHISALSYQWSFNATNISGATNASLVLTNVQLSQTGNYAVQVSNPYGMTNSSAATLTVISQFSCAPAPLGLISWWPSEGNPNDAAGVNNGLANNIGYTVGEVGSAFYLNGSNAYVKVPASASLNVGTSNGFTFETWINPTNLNPQVIAEWNNDAGGIGVHLWLSGGSVGAGPAGCLYANLYSGANHIISTGGGLITTSGFQHIALTYDKTSGMAVLYLNGSPVQSSNLGTFTPQTSYDFYLGERASGALAGNYFCGAMDEPSLYSRALTAIEIQTIYLVGSFGKCPLTSPAIIITQPTDQTVTAGDTVTFGVVASGTAPLTYQWQKNGSPLTDGGNVSGSATTNLVLTNVQTNDLGCYSVIVTNLYGSALSSNAVLTVLIPPTITTQPTNVIALVGNTVVFTIVADGTAPFSYQWAFNNTNLDNATNLILTLTNIQPDQAGVYSVTVTNLAGGVISSNAVLCIYSSAVSTLSGVSLNTDNNIQFTVSGVPSFNYAVQASTNLIDWFPLVTNTSPFTFVDTNTSGNPQQFYRSIYLY